MKILLRRLYWRLFFAYIKTIRGGRIKSDEIPEFPLTCKILLKNKNVVLKLGKNLVFEDGVVISINGHGICEIGDKVVLRQGCHIEVGKEGHVQIGQESFLNRLCHVVSGNYIELGMHNAIGMGVIIMDTDHKVSSKGRQDWGISQKGTVVIGDEVWIGANTIVLKDTKIESNSVIAAGSIVKGYRKKGKIYYDKRNLTSKEIGAVGESQYR